MRKRPLGSTCSEVLKHSGQESAFPRQGGTWEQRDLERQEDAYKMHETSESGRSAAIMLALSGGPAGAENLEAWASYVRLQNAELPSIWAICPDHSGHIAMVENLDPQLRFRPLPLVVDADSSWAEVLTKFLLQVYYKSNTVVVLF